MRSQLSKITQQTQCGIILFTLVCSIHKESRWSFLCMPSDRGKMQREQIVVHCRRCHGGELSPWSYWGFAYILRLYATLRNLSTQGRVFFGHLCAPLSFVASTLNRPVPSGKEVNVSLSCFQQFLSGGSNVFCCLSDIGEGLVKANLCRSWAHPFQTCSYRSFLPHGLM